MTEDGEKEICIGYKKYVETGVQYGSCYRWYRHGVKEQLRRKSRNCAQRKLITYVKRTKTKSQ